MDILTDTLHLAGLKTHLLHQRDFPAHATALFPCSRSLGFHVVLKGTAFIHTKDKKLPLKLERGDIALMARGCHHYLSTNEKSVANPKTLNEFKNSQSSGHSPLTVVSGAYQLWNDPVHPFFLEIPTWFILKKDDIGLNDGIYQMTDLLAKETAQAGLGSERVIQGILDVMFSLIMRRVVNQLGANQTRWASSMQDQQIRKLLELLHRDLKNSWSLPELAKEVGISRSSLAARFKQLTGDSPLHYLVTLRIQKAINLLTTTDMSVEQIAFEVGYKDSFTFSKAFKKLVGLPPREYRRKQLTTQGLA